MVRYVSILGLLLTNVKRLLLLFVIVCLFSCGGGGRIILSEGNIDDSGGVAGIEIDSQQLPGTSAIQLQAGRFDLVVEVGSAVPIVDTLSDSGKFEIKSDLLFVN